MYQYGQNIYSIIINNILYVNMIVFLTCLPMSGVKTLEVYQLQSFSCETQAVLMNLTNCSPEFILTNRHRKRTQCV